jgi:hypothetical protein|tara:strand:- start:89 stop:274 length:186 start_codon:yes stop_codon:yes gene_type:complete
MVEYTYPHIKRKVKKLDKELEVNELAIHFQTQFDEGENNISFKDAYEMAYNEILYSHIVLS